jgi:hypothetical protein
MLKQLSEFITCARICVVSREKILHHPENVIERSFARVELKAEPCMVTDNDFRRVVSLDGDRND